MKKIQPLLLFFTLLGLGCGSEVTAPQVVTPTKLYSEEYLTYDPLASNGGFVSTFKKLYHYDRNKLVEVVVYEYDPGAHSYDLGTVLEEFHYTDDGRLSQLVHFLGTTGIKTVEEFEYINQTITRVTRTESSESGSINSKDSLVMERTPTSLEVRYFQLSDQQYAQLNYDIDGRGNVISVIRNPPFSVGKISYKHDDSPNPYKFLALSGEYGSDSEKYISENNVVEESNDFNNPKLVRTIEYDELGFPVTVITATSKSLFVYQ